MDRASEQRSCQQAQRRHESHLDRHDDEGEPVHSRLPFCLVLFFLAPASTDSTRLISSAVSPRYSIRAAISRSGSPPQALSTISTIRRPRLTSRETSGW